VRSLLGAIGALLAIAGNLPPVAAHAGTLVLVGGGPTPSQVFERTLSLAGGRRAMIAVLPQTYPTDSLADAAVTLWRSFQPREVVKVSRTDPAAMRTVLERSTLIWMPGGFPSFLMRSIEGTPIPDVIRTRFAAGITVGGASAGAVAMSETMLADETTPDGDPIDGPVTIEGLGLWPEAIVSPHFTERHRLGPLIPVVANHPTLFGVGIDEGTAVLVSRGEFEVLGRGTVSIVAPHSPPVRTLKTGMRFRYQPRSHS
jgi:cyanophycinase